MDMTAQDGLLTSTKEDIIRDINELIEEGHSTDEVRVIVNESDATELHKQFARYFLDILCID